MFKANEKIVVLRYTGQVYEILTGVYDSPDRLLSKEESYVLYTRETIPTLVSNKAIYPARFKERLQEIIAKREAVLEELTVVANLFLTLRQEIENGL